MKKHPTWEVVETKPGKQKGNWRIRLRAKNGEIVLVGEGYVGNRVRLVQRLLRTMEIANEALIHPFNFIPLRKVKAKPKAKAK